MKRTSLKPCTTRLKRRAPIKPRKRTETAFNRIYGSRARCKLMRMRPCDHCGQVPPSEDFQNQNAHTETGGTAYKAGWETVVTLCPGCHRALHHLGSTERFLEITGTDLRAIARRLAVEIPA